MIFSFSSNPAHLASLKNTNRFQNSSIRRVSKPTYYGNSITPTCMVQLRSGQPDGTIGSSFRIRVAHRGIYI